MAKNQLKYPEPFHPIVEDSDAQIPDTHSSEENISPETGCWSIQEEESALSFASSHGGDHTPRITTAGMIQLPQKCDAASHYTHKSSNNDTETPRLSAMGKPPSFTFQSYLRAYVTQSQQQLPARRRRPHSACPWSGDVARAYEGREFSATTKRTNSISSTEELFVGGKYGREHYRGHSKCKTRGVDADKDVRMPHASHKSATSARRHEHLDNRNDDDGSGAHTEPMVHARGQSSADASGSDTCTPRFVYGPKDTLRVQGADSGQGQEGAARRHVQLSRPHTALGTYRHSHSSSRDNRHVGQHQCMHESDATAEESDIETSIPNQENLLRPLSMGMRNKTQTARIMSDTSSSDHDSLRLQDLEGGTPRHNARVHSDAQHHAHHGKHLVSADSGRKEAVATGSSQIHTPGRLHVCIYVCMYVCMYVCIV